MTYLAALRRVGNGSTSEKTIMRSETDFEENWDVPKDAAPADAPAADAKSKDEQKKDA